MAANRVANLSGAGDPGLIPRVAAKLYVVLATLTRIVSCLRRALVDVFHLEISRDA